MILSFGSRNLIIVVLLLLCIIAQAAPYLSTVRYFETVKWKLVYYTRALVN